MSKLADFFKGSDTTLGTFYPTHYLVAVVRNPDVAREVLEKLRYAGFTDHDAIAAEGSEIVELMKAESGLGSFFMQVLSRFFATEQIFADHDLQHAREGAGFIAVHCVSEHLKHEAWSIIAEAGPFDARYYGSGSIEHLAGDLKTD